MIQARVVLPCTSDTCLFILSGVQREVNHFICSHEVRRWDVLFADAFPVQLWGILKGTPVEFLCTSSTGLFHAWCRRRTKVWELPSAMSRHASVPKNIDYVDRSLEKNQLKTQINQWRNELTILQIISEMFTCRRRSPSPPCRVWSHLHSFIDYIWTRFTCMISDRWPGPVIGPSCHHHLVIMMSPSDDHWSGHYSAEVQSLNGNPVLLNDAGFSTKSFLFFFFLNCVPLPLKAV